MAVIFLRLGCCLADYIIQRKLRTAWELPYCMQSLVHNHDDAVKGFIALGIPKKLVRFASLEGRHSYPVWHKPCVSRLWQHALCPNLLQTLPDLADFRILDFTLLLGTQACLQPARKLMGNQVLQNCFNLALGADAAAGH